MANIGKWRFIIVFFLLAGTLFYLKLHKDILVPMNKPLESFPTSVQGWKMISQTAFDLESLEVLRPTDYLYRTYASADGNTVQLYIGYHGGGPGGGEIHSPKQCLPGSGWYNASTRKVVLDAADRHVNMVQAIYQKGDVKELFLYWFQVQALTLSNEYALKWAEISNSLLHRRRDATFVRISISLDKGEEQATATGQQFVRDFFPVIQQFLPL